MSIAVKISTENYRELSVLSGRLQETNQKPTSLNEALSFLLKRRKISDLAGTWKGSDKEAEKIMKDLRKGWGSWQIKSV